MQKQEKKFYGSQEQFFDKTVIWDRTPPSIYQMQCICVGEGSRVPNLQTEFNYLDSCKSYGILVILLSPWSLCFPHHPHVVPVIPASSLLSPHHPHSPQKVPVIPVVPTHVVPIVPVIPTLSLLFPHHLEGPQIIPNPWGGGGPQITKNAIRFELIKIF